MVAAAVDGGVDMVQVREKDMPASQLLDLCTTIRHVTEGRALLFVNDRMDVAMACGADGVQLGEEGLSPAAARRMAGGELLLGRSVHSVEGAAEAASQGVDLLIVGTVFATPSHPDASVTGTGVLRRLRGRVEAPYLAIGGVDLANVESVVRAGASGAAVISAVCANDDPEGVARALKARVSEAWAARSDRRQGTPT